MAVAPEPKALSFARQSIKEKISGPVDIYWKDIRKVLNLKNPVPVVLAPGCCLLLFLFLGGGLLLLIHLF